MSGRGTFNSQRMGELRLKRSLDSEKAMKSLYSHLFSFDSCKVCRSDILLHQQESSWGKHHEILLDQRLPPAQIHGRIAEYELHQAERGTVCVHAHTDADHHE